MADTTTTNYGLTKPEVGASEDSWGDKVNTDMDLIDTQMKSSADVAAAALPKAGGTMTGVIVNFESTGIDDNATGTIATVSDTGIDVTGTVTTDGLASSSTILVNHAGSLNNAIQLGDLATIGSDTGVYFRTTGVAHLTIPDSADLLIDGTSNQKFANFAGNGDISFYEDTGTTAKFFWDASAESLGIGTSSPAFNLTVRGAANQSFLSTEDSTGVYRSIYGTDSSVGAGALFGSLSNHPAIIRTKETCWWALLMQILKHQM